MKSKEQIKHNPMRQLLENKPAAPKATQTWDELEDYYQTMARAMVDLAASVKDSVDVMTTLNYKGNAELVTTIRTLLADCSGPFTQRLLDLRAQHSVDGVPRTGSAKDGKEIAEILALAQGYQVFYSQYTTVTFSQVMIVTEHMDAAQLAHAQFRAANAATDPNVVTDVEFKETAVQTSTEEKPE
jgi:hypothetical protein